MLLPCLTRRSEIPCRTKRLIALVFCGGFAACGVTVGALGALLLDLAARTDISIGAAGSAITGFGIGQVAAAFASGLLLEFGPGHLQLVFCFAVDALGCALLPYVRSLAAMMACTACFGVGMGVLDTAGNVMVLWLWGCQSGPFLQGSHCCFGIGALAAPFLLRWAGDVRDPAAQDAPGPSASGDNVLSMPGWASVLFGNAAFLLVLALATCLLPSPQRRAARSDKADHGASAGAPTVLKRRTLYERRWDWTVTVLTALYLCFYLGLEMGFGGFIYTYVVDHLGESSGTATGILSLFWVCYTLGRLLDVPFAAYAAPTTMMATFHSLTLLSTCLLLVLPNSTLVAWAVAAIYGAGISGMFACAITLSEGYVHVDGKTATVFIVGSSVGKMSLPLLVTSAYDEVSFLAFPSLLLAYAVCGTCIVVLLVLCGKRAAAARLRAEAGTEEAVGEADGVKPTGLDGERPDATVI